MVSWFSVSIQDSGVAFQRMVTSVFLCGNKGSCVEILLVGLLAFLLFWEKCEKTRDQLIAACRSNPRGLIKYLGAASALSLSLSFLPGLLLTIYMRTNDFFAYEVFGSENYAFQVLSWNVFFNFTMLSVYLFLSIYLWKKGAGAPTVFGGAMISALLIGILVYGVVSTGRYALGFAILVFCLLVGGSLYFWITSGFEEKARYWMVPLFFSGLFLILPVIFHQHAALFTESALAQMKVGGVDAELSEPLGFASTPQSTTLRGRLLLRTSAFYYIRPERDQAHVFIVSTEHVSLRYLTTSGKKSGVAGPVVP